MNRLRLLFTAAAIVLLGWTAEASAQQRLRIMEYNVENLFDTIHTAPLLDGEFTPAGSYHWTERRYWKKLADISRVIAAVGGDAPPALVALVEVENDSVVSHLPRRPRLWRAGYDYVITHSADARGINVALLYLPHAFRPVGHDTLRIAPPRRSSFTRDVLHVAGLIATGDTLDVWVCHWPSRRGGKESEAYRNRVAAVLRSHIDSVLAVRTTPLAVVTGDFNAFHPEPSVARHLGAVLPSPTPQTRMLYLLSAGMEARCGIRGTYKFQGEWNQLDNFAVSGALLAPPRSDCPHTSRERCRIADFPFLLRDADSPERIRPYRTFLGTYHQGGFSDHLPLVLDLFIE